MRGWYFFIFLLFTLQVHAWQATVAPKFNLYPMTPDLVATFKKEGFLFDRRAENNTDYFGLWSGQLTGSAQGQMEGSFSLYPISFLRLTAGAGGSGRFIQGAMFNCSLINCQGFVTELRLGFGFLVQTGENKEWSVQPEYNVIQISSAQTTLPIADNNEFILANATGDILDQFSLQVGKKMDARWYGLLARQAQYRSSGQHNELQALVVKSTWRDTTAMLGVGRYASSLAVPGIDVFFSYEWRWGYSQAFF